MFWSLYWCPFIRFHGTSLSLSVRGRDWGLIPRIPTQSILVAYSRVTGVSTREGGVSWLEVRGEERGSCPLIYRLWIHPSAFPEEFEIRVIVSLFHELTTFSEKWFVNWNDGYQYLLLLSSMKPHHWSAAHFSLFSPKNTSLAPGPSRYRETIPHMPMTRSHYCKAQECSRKVHAQWPQ